MKDIEKRIDSLTEDQLFVVDILLCGKSVIGENETSDAIKRFLDCIEFSNSPNNDESIEPLQ